ncbi:MAG: type II secretion system minor pseudopilin GspH [Methylococcaceae bacterium]|nr:type II secretion system minor pseudopilin GspH [Methylococcaceae bacterium]
MNYHRGFTLLELLVVLVIIGLFSGLVMMSVTPNDNQAVHREAKRFMHIIQLAQDEAIMQGVELGVTVQSDRYFFSRLQENQWLPLTGDAHLMEYELNPSVTMTIEVEDEMVVQEINEDVFLPAIMVLSSGELTAFKLSLFNQTTPERMFQIIGQENGQLSLQNPDE